MGYKIAVLAATLFSPGAVHADNEFAASSPIVDPTDPNGPPYSPTGSLVEIMSPQQQGPDSLASQGELVSAGLNYAYVHDAPTGACGTTGCTAFHARCHCLSQPLNFCRDECDSLATCKGYVSTSQAHGRPGCQYAVDDPNTQCHASCEKHNHGTVGALGICPNFFASTYMGCHRRVGLASNSGPDPSVFGDCKHTRHCLVQGDPHIKTFDDFRYSYQENGEYQLASSAPNTAARNAAVHGCFGSFSTHSVSYTTKLAFECDGHIVVAQAKDPNVVKLYKQTAPNTFTLSTDWGSVAVSTMPGSRANTHVIRCPTTSQRQLGTTAVVAFRQVTEHKNTAQVQVLSVMIFSDVDATAGTLKGLCNSWPSPGVGQFQSRSGQLISFPDQTAASKAAFVANANGPMSWAVQAQDSLFSKVGVSCPVADGQGAVLAAESEESADSASRGPRALLDMDNLDYSACDNDKKAIRKARRCVRRCQRLHGLNTPALSDCVYDILAECDPVCSDANTQDQ